MSYTRLLPPDYHCSLLTSRKFTRDDIASWLDLHQLKCVVILGQSTLDLIRKLELQAPEDLAIVFGFWRDGDASIAGYEPHYHAVSAAAVDIVVSQIYRNELGIPKYQKTTIINSLWREGSSLPGEEREENIPASLRDKVVWPTPF